MSEYIIDMGNSSYQSTSGLLCADVSQLKEEIVRCRDCRYLEVFYPFDVYRMKQSEIPEYHCESSQFSNYDFPIEVEPDGFCAWGERKVVDE